VSSTAGQTCSVEITAEVELEAAPELVRPLIRDLDRYPSWLSIVAKAASESEDSSAWAVELRGKVGPLARSKRLRMVRTIDEPEHIRFERRERDGRQHSSWTLDAHVSATSSGSHLVMVLRYGGGFGGGIVERLLADEIEQSKVRLRLLLETNAGTS